MKNKIISTSLLLLLITTSSILAVSLNIEPAQSSTTNITLSGHVYDAQGNAAVRAHTSLVSIINGRGEDYCYTDSSGFYSLSVPKGTYILLSYLTGSTLSYSQRNMTLTSDTTLDITLVVGFKISGRVYDTSGQVVAGALTVVSNSTWLVPGVNTDSSGYYTIYAPKGVYSFALWPPANSRVMNFLNETVAVDSDMTFNIVMDSGYTVSGNVQYPSGNKAPGVSTQLINATGYVFSSGRYSDTMPTRGTYCVAVPAGTYTLQSTINSTVVYSEPDIVVTGDVTKDITLISVSISPSDTVIDAGQTYQYIASASGGSRYYINYTWYVNGYAKATTDTPTFDFSPSEPGTYHITAVTKDSRNAFSTQSTTALATVNPALVPPEVSSSSSFLDQGQTFSLSASEASAGTAPYSYQWYSKAPSASNYTKINGATQLSYTFITSSQTEVGKWGFVLNATDSASNSNTVSSQAASVWVNPPPTVSVSPKLAILNEGSTKTFTAFASGGSGPFTYEWFLDNLKVGENDISYLYTATYGAHTLHAKVTDSANPPQSATSKPVAITVNSPLTTPTASTINSIIDQGQAFNLTSTAAVNGTAPYTYQWYAKSPNGNFSALPAATSPNCSVTTLNNVTTGVWYLVLYVTDSATVPVTVTSNVILITVNSVPSVSVSASSETFTVGQSCTFTANASGGSSSYTRYQWYVNGAVQSGQTGSAFIFSPSTAGSYSVTATVTDSLDATSVQSSTVAVQVSPAPTPTPAPTATSSPTPAATPTQTPTPSPISTPTPTASTSSSSPSATHNVQQGPETGTYTIIVVVLAIVVVALIAAILLSKKKLKATKP